MSIKKMILDDLNYCCLQQFLTLYSNNELIAARLGVSRIAVNNWRNKVKKGMECCDDKEKCFKRRLK